MNLKVTQKSNKFKELTSQLNELLDEYKSELNRIISLVPIPFTCDLEEYSLLNSKIQSFILDNDPHIKIKVWALSEIEKDDIKFEINIPRSLLFSDKESIVKFWQNLRVIRVIQKKYVKN